MKTNRRQITIIVLILISVVSIVMSLNKYICLPWETGITVEDPVEVQSNGQNTVIMGSNMTSITVLNDKNELENQIDINVLDSNYTYLPSVALTDKYCYFVIQEYLLNSSFLNSEEVVRSPGTGKKTESVLKLIYETDKQIVSKPRITRLIERKGECYALIRNLDSNALAVVNISDGSNKDLAYSDIKFDKRINSQNSIAFAWYDSGKDKVYAMDQFGQAYSWKWDSSGEGISTDAFESDAYYRALYANSVAISTIEDVSKAKTPEFSDDKYNFNKHVPAEIKAFRGKSFSNNKLSQLRIWLFWFGVLVLAFLLILSLVKFIHRLRIQANFAFLKRIALFAAIGIACLIIVIFYSYQLINTTVESSTSMQKVLVQMTQEQTIDLIKQAKSEFDTNGQVSIETYNSIEKKFKKTSQISSNEEHGTVFTLTLIQDGRYYPIISTPQVILSASLNRDISELNELKANEIISTSSISPIGGFSFSRAVYTDDSNQPIATLYATNDITVTTADYLKTCADIFLKLFVGALAIVYAVMEIMAWLNGFRRRKTLLQEGIDFQGVALARPLGFLAISINAADSALIVLIVKDMLVGTPYENNLVICSLPMTAMGLGFLFGGITAHNLLSRFNAKKILLVATIVMAISLIGESAAVYKNNIPLLLLAMIIMTIGNEVVLYYASGYAGLAPNDDLRRSCNGGISASKISSYALITIFAGYASTMFGNYTIYLVALLPTAILLAIILLNSFDNRKIITSESSAAKIGFKDKMKFLGTPEMIILIFCGILASEILGGYRSYVFPLFADQGGISKSTISNIQVFAKAIVFFSIPLINKFQKRLREKNFIVTNNIILAGVFFMFIINQSVIWAIVALIATYISSRGIDSSVSFIWQKYAIDNEYDPGMAQSAIGNTTQLINITKTPILGWLMGFGQLISCIIIGSYLGISSFALKASSAFAKKSN